MEPCGSKDISRLQSNFLVLLENYTVKKRFTLFFKITWKLSILYSNGLSPSQNTLFPVHKKLLCICLVYRYVWVFLNYIQFKSGIKRRHCKLRVILLTLLEKEIRLYTGKWFFSQSYNSKWHWALYYFHHFFIRNICNMICSYKILGLILTYQTYI